MPTKNPRVNVVLEEPLYEELSLWAKRDGISLSLKVRDLVKEALEIEEDRALARIAEKREQSFDLKKVLTHRQVWSRSSRPRRCALTAVPPESSGGGFIWASGKHPTSDSPGDRGPA